MLKTASVFLLIGLLFGTFYSLAVIVSPQGIANSTLQAMAGTRLENIQDETAAKAIVAQTRHLGIFALTTNIAMLFIFFVGFKKAQKWAWWAFLFVAGIAWIYGLVTEIHEGDKMNMIGHAIGIVLWLIGILLPLKAFFAKKA